MLRVRSEARSAAGWQLVLFLGEIDLLQAESLISVFRQLRSGYADRPQGFPQSLGLIGMRDIRDYKVKSGGSGHLRTASPFNTDVESLTLCNFTADETAHLLSHQTTETVQRFEPSAQA